LEGSRRGSIPLRSTRWGDQLDAGNGDRDKGPYKNGQGGFDSRTLRYIPPTASVVGQPGRPQGRPELLRQERITLGKTEGIPSDDITAPLARTSQRGVFVSGTFPGCPSRFLYRCRASPCRRRGRTRRRWDTAYVLFCLVHHSSRRVVPPFPGVPYLSNASLSITSCRP
jgi:hypothetical protein